EQRDVEAAVLRPRARHAAAGLEVSVRLHPDAHAAQVEEPADDVARALGREEDRLGGLEQPAELLPMADERRHRIGERLQPEQRALPIETARLIRRGPALGRREAAETIRLLVP